MAPLLVRLYDTHRVYALAKDKRAPARAELSNIVMDMFRADLTAREAELVTEVLIGLMQQAERDLRQALAERLAESGNVPLRLILHLANDEISVADNILRNSPVLNDLDLIYIIKSQGPEYWRSIALRKSLSDQIIDLLADTEEPLTIKNLTENNNIILTDTSLRIIARMAMENEGLASPLLHREEVPKEIALRLYRLVGEELKEYITGRYEIDENEIGSALDKAVSDLTTADKSIYLPDSQMMMIAQMSKERGNLVISEMIDVLRRGDIRMFVAQFSIYARIPPEMVIETLSHRYGQGFAIACKALGIEKADFLTIYFLTQRMRKASRIANKQDIAQALACYERTVKEAALRLLENSRS